MLIDFHSHIFPERIASGAIRSLSDSIVSYQGVRHRHYARGNIDIPYQSCQGYRLRWSRCAVLYEQGLILLLYPSVSQKKK